MPLAENTERTQPEMLKGGPCVLGIFRNLCLKKTILVPKRPKTKYIYTIKIRSVRDSEYKTLSYLQLLKNYRRHHWFTILHALYPSKLENEK